VSDAGKGKDKEAEKAAPVPAGMPKGGDKILLHLMFRDTWYRVKTYCGTPRADLEATIKQKLGLSKEARPTYLDDEGDEFTLSSYVPNETRIFVVCELVGE